MATEARALKPVSSLSARLGALLTRLTTKVTSPGRPIVVDDGVLKALRMAIGERELHVLLKDGITAYTGYCKAIAIAADIRDPAQVASHAHKLKGSAATLGLIALSQAALAIESAALAGRCEPRAVLDLQRLLAQTQIQLREAGWLH